MCFDAKCYHTMALFEEQYEIDKVKTNNGINNKCQVRKCYNLIISNVKILRCLFWNITVVINSLPSYYKSG